MLIPDQSRNASSLQFTKKAVLHNGGDADPNNGGATAFAGANDCGDLRFGSEQLKPRVGQLVNVATVARAKDGMARHNLYAFGNTLRLHGAMSEIIQAPGRW